MCGHCNGDTDYEVEGVAVDGENSPWCITCAETHANHCDSCDRFTTDNMVTIDDCAEWCPDCLDSSTEATCCERCGEYTVETVTEVDDREALWCLSCVTDYAMECPTCGAFSSNPVDDSGYCSTDCLPTTEEEPEEENYYERE